MLLPVFFPNQVQHDKTTHGGDSPENGNRMTSVKAGSKQEDADEAEKRFEREDPAPATAGVVVCQRACWLLLKNGKAGLDNFL